MARTNRTRKGAKTTAGRSAKTGARRTAKTGTQRAAKAETGSRSRGAATRERLDTGTDQRLVRRSRTGQFSESDDVGRAAASDQRRKAKRKAPRGQGDRGDRPRPAGGRRRG
jgi:hypothetical protein